MSGKIAVLALICASLLPTTSARAELRVGAAAELITPGVVELVNLATDGKFPGGNYYGGAGLALVVALAHPGLRILPDLAPVLRAPAVLDEPDDGLYGRVGPLADFFIGIVIYSLQIPFSIRWLSTHRYGPMEWVWRQATYGRRVGLKRT